ncbi:hypothetical protein K144316041_p21680 (plasmid) [Clostridium tetani]|uniref:hypothetical protein n=1 Tax=Clostridium tetani TaxID=1513 RepID=UPI0029536B12|nr:hypothetical protein [Clostridium tetani]BDR74329.1 hypothetical protein K144316041_p21680 [Clostridium tetani]
MNVFKELFILCKQFDFCRDKKQREHIKEQMATITSDMINTTIIKDDIRILRNEFGFKISYVDYTHKEKVFKMTFSDMTKKTYIYNGQDSFEFKVL